MKNLLLSITLIAGCIDPPDTRPEEGRWLHNTAVTVRVLSNAPESSAIAMRNRAIRDMYLWSDAIVARGCEVPFHFVEDEVDADRMIDFLPRELWATTGAVGATYGSRIEILTQADGTLDMWINDPSWIVLVHELGHALGLGHNDSDPDSVMQSASNPDMLPLVAVDINNAVAEIGCK